MLVAGVKLAAGVAALGGLEHAVGQFHGLRADQVAQAVAQAVGNGAGAVVGDGGVDGVDQFAGAGEFEGEHDVLGLRYCPAILAARGRSGSRAFRVW